MRILFVHNFSKPDYLADSIYHGLIDLGFEVHTNTYPTDMYEETVQNKQAHNLYGKLKGDPICLDYGSLCGFILSQYYDKIIYGNIRNEHRMFWADRLELKKFYRKDQIHFLDGEDDTFILKGLEEFGVLWKRELTSEQAEPISFSIPESQIKKESIEKTQLLATVIPGNLETYKFPNEYDYNMDYQKSYYGITHKKAGWDCYRHYEILANRCVPYFVDVKECPERTMKHFPKDLINECNRYAEKGLIHPNYDSIVNDLVDYTIKNLTTKRMAERIINF